MCKRQRKCRPWQFQRSQCSKARYSGHLLPRRAYICLYRIISKHAMWLKAGSRVFYSPVMLSPKGTQITARIHGQNKRFPIELIKSLYRLMSCRRRELSSSSSESDISFFVFTGWESDSAFSATLVSRGPSSSSLERREALWEFDSRVTPAFTINNENFVSNVQAFRYSTRTISTRSLCIFQSETYADMLKPRQLCQLGEINHYLRKGGKAQPQQFSCLKR